MEDMIARNEQLETQLALMRKERDELKLNIEAQLTQMKREREELRSNIQANNVEVMHQENEALQKKIELTTQLAQAQAQVQSASRAVPAAGPSTARPAIGLNDIGGDTGKKMAGLRLQFYLHDGKISWSSWRIHYNQIHDICQWPDDEARKLCKGSMFGDAADTVSDLTVDMFPNVKAMLDAFGERFQPHAARALAQTQYETAQQEKDETLLMFHNRLKKLFKNAFPKKAEMWREDEDLVKRFIMGIRNGKCREKTDTHTTLSEVVDYAKVLQTAQSMVSVAHREEFYHNNGNGKRRNAAELANAGGNGRGANGKDEVNGIGQNQEEEEPAVSYLGNNQRRVQSRLCKYGPCQQRGHWKEDCPKYLQMKVRQMPHLFSSIVLQSTQQGPQTHSNRGFYSQNRGQFNNRGYFNNRGNRGWRGGQNRGRGGRGRFRGRGGYSINQVGQGEGAEEYQYENPAEVYQEGQQYDPQYTYEEQVPQQYQAETSQQPQDFQ